MISELAKMFNQNEETVKSGVVFVVGNMQRNPSLLAEFSIATDSKKSKIIKDGLKAWLKSSEATYAEILSGKTDNAKAFYSQF